MKTLYRCNPELNDACEKINCGKWCTMTTNEMYSVDGRKLTEEEIHEEEQKCRDSLGDPLFARKEKGNNELIPVRSGEK